MVVFLQLQIFVAVENMANHGMKQQNKKSGKRRLMILLPELSGLLQTNTHNNQSLPVPAGAMVAFWSQHVCSNAQICTAL